MSATLWDGLVARYCPSLDTNGNGTTTLHNLDGNGAEVGSNNGTLTNMDAATDWVADTANGGVRALDFDGSNDFVNCGSDSALNAGTLTLSGWLYHNSNSARGFLASRYAMGSKGWSIEVTTGQLRVRLRTGPDYVDASGFTAADNLALNSWHHIALRFDDTLTVYLSGALVYTDAVTFASFDLLPLNLGKGFYTQSQTVAQAGRQILDDICIFNDAKSASDIAILASQRGIQAAVVPRINGGLINGGLINHGLINGGLVR